MNPAPTTPMKKSRIILWAVMGGVAALALILGMVVAGGSFLAHQAGLEADNIRVVDASKGAFEVKPVGQSAQAGQMKLPAWVPGYPGASVEKSFSGQSEDSQSGTYTFKTKDSPDHVLNYYRDGLKQAGLTMLSVVNAGPSKVLTAQDEGKHHVVNVVISGGDETSVTVSFTSK